MESSERTAQRLPELMIARHVLPAILLVLSLVVTYHLWRDAKRTADHSLQASFSFRVRELNEQISQRVLSYQQLLLGTAGLFAASEEVTRDEFHAYVESLGLEERFPGIHGIGYAQHLMPAEKEAHEQTIRKSGFPDYVIWPAGRRDSYTSILYLEPFAGRNLRAFGYDMYTDPVRRAAMGQARDSGKAVISGKVTLVQETNVDVQSGFLAYLPVYRNHMPHDSLSSRRANLLGWVYAPFRMDDLMRDIQNLHGNDLDIEIYDGETASAGALMYDSGGPGNAVRAHEGLRSAQVMEIGEHRWLVVATALPAFQNRVDYGRADLVLRGGVCISLLLGLLVWVFLDDRARAIQAADQAYRLALYDTLTGLPNRKLVLERLAQALVKARRNHAHVALLFIDLDRFKPVNDEHGHAVGDLLLKEVAHRLQGCMRASDTAARVGGDEFIALLPDVGNRDDAAIAAEKIRQAMEHPFEVAGHTFEIAASIGIALYPDDATDQNALMARADHAMYQAKNGGRNAVCFASASDRR